MVTDYESEVKLQSTGCIGSLTQIGRHSITLTWVPAHEGVMGNEVADECAREGSGLARLRFWVGPLAGVRHF